MNDEHKDYYIIRPPEPAPQLPDPRPPTPAEVVRAAAHLKTHGFRFQLAGQRNFNTAANLLASSRTYRKGILITGDVGTGKTTFLHAAFPNSEYFDFKNPESLKYFAPSGSVPVRDYRGKTVVFDDIGADHGTNNYGIKEFPVLDFVIAFLMQGDGMIHLSTNLTVNELGEAYGSRVDFFKEKFVYGEFEGESRRAWSEVTTYDVGTEWKKLQKEAK